MLRSSRTFLLLLFVGTAAPACTPADPAHAIAGPHARELVRNGAMLIDVRSSLEFWWSHVDGAVNISSSSLPEKMKEFDRTRAIVVYSRSGARSAQARDMLKAAGFEAYDLGAKRNW